MDALRLIRNLYAPYPDAMEILIAHSLAVAQKAVETGRKVAHLNPDMKFIEESAMLHDIGMFMTKAPMLGCHGDKPYICHGVIGAGILREEGLDRHAHVCERHVGVGLSAEDIIKKGFPLPPRDMLPVSIEEIIVCYADKFFSKNNGEPVIEKPLDEVRESIRKYGPRQLRTFDGWVEMFEGLKRQLTGLY